MSPIDELAEQYRARGATVIRLRCSNPEGAAEALTDLARHTELLRTQAAGRAAKRSVA